MESWSPRLILHNIVIEEDLLFEIELCTTPNRFIPNWSAYGIQDGWSESIKIRHTFHDWVFIVILLVLTLIFVALRDVFRFYRANRFHEFSVLEVWWTVTPAVILLMIAIPSLNLLYYIDEVERATLTVNVLGYQWYWEYIIPAVAWTGYDSYITSTPPFSLEVDNRLTLPCETLVRMLVRGGDVIHSWTVPRFGVKVDAVPGRINQTGVESYVGGLFYGQCSEICGANHRFIPIRVEMLDIYNWRLWAKT